MERTWAEGEDEGPWGEREVGLPAPDAVRDSLYGPELQARMAEFAEEQKEMAVLTALTQKQGRGGAPGGFGGAGGFGGGEGSGGGGVEGGLSSTFMKSVNSILRPTAAKAKTQTGLKAMMESRKGKAIQARGEVGDRGLRRIRESATTENNLKRAVRILRNQDLLPSFDAMVRHAAFWREERAARQAFAAVHAGLLKPHAERSLGERAAIEDFCRLRMPHFFGMSQYALQVVCSLMKLEKVRAGELLIKEGDAGDDFYIVASGLMVVWQHLGTAEEEERHLRWKLDQAGGPKSLAGSDLLRELYEKEGLGHLAKKRTDLQPITRQVSSRRLLGKLQATARNMGRLTKRDIFLGTQIATKRTGELFGERAVLFGTKRNASVSAIIDSYVLSLNRLENLRTVQLAEETDLRRSIDLLSRVPFLGDESVQDLRALAVECSLRTFPSGSIVLSEGGAPSGLFIIVSGTADLVQATATYRERSVSEGGVDRMLFPALRRELDRIGGMGAFIKLATLERLDHFGEFSMLTGKAQPCTVVAMSELKVLFVPLLRHGLALTEEAIAALWTTCTGPHGAYPTLEELHMRLIEVTEWNRAKRGMVGFEVFGASPRELAAPPSHEVSATSTVAATTVAQIMAMAPVSPELKHRLVELQDKAYSVQEAAFRGPEFAMWRRRQGLKLVFLGPEVPVLFVKVLALHPSEGVESPWSKDPSILDGKDWNKLKNLFATDTQLLDTFCLDVLFDEWKVLATDYGVLGCRWSSDEFLVLGCQPGKQCVAADNAVALLAKLALAFKVSALKGYYRKLLSMAADDFALTGSAQCTVSAGLASGSLMATYYDNDRSAQGHLQSVVGTGMDVARELCLMGCNPQGPRSEFSACRMTHKMSAQLPPAAFELEEVSVYRYIEGKAAATADMERCMRLNGCNLPGFEQLSRGLAEGRKAAVLDVVGMGDLDDEEEAAQAADKPAWQREVEIFAYHNHQDVYALMLPSVRDVMQEDKAAEVLAQLQVNHEALGAFSSELKDVREEPGQLDKGKLATKSAVSKIRRAMSDVLMNRSRTPSSAPGSRLPTAGERLTQGEVHMRKLMRARKKALSRRYRLSTGDDGAHDKLLKKATETKNMCAHVKVVIKLRPEDQSLTSLGKDLPSVATSWFADKVQNAVMMTRSNELKVISEFEAQAYEMLKPPSTSRAVSRARSNPAKSPAEVLSLERGMQPNLTRQTQTPSFDRSVTLPPVGKGTGMMRVREDEVDSAESPRTKAHSYNVRNIFGGKVRRVEGTVLVDAKSAMDKSALSHAGWF